MENTGRSRDRSHGQTVKAVTLFSGGTLTSHLSCLSVKRKEEGRRMVEGFFFHLLFNKPDDKALSTHKVTPHCEIGTTPYKAKIRGHDWPTF